MLALFPDVFPDACLISGCVSGCLPCAPLCYLASGGSKISTKNVPGTKTLGPPLGYLASGGSKISKQNVPGENKSHIWDI